MEAHAIGYVHRDLRPRNIYLAHAPRQGELRQAARLRAREARRDRRRQRASTSLGMTFGDPRYMSPEQARGDRIDRRADIYQLGCVAYEMLTGAPPFTGNRVFDILTKQVTEIAGAAADAAPGRAAVDGSRHREDAREGSRESVRDDDAHGRGAAPRPRDRRGDGGRDRAPSRSVPPPSVSRVMQKMGLTPDTGVPPFKPTATTKGIAPVSEPVAAPRPATPTPPPAKPDSVELIRRRTNTPNLGLSNSAAAAVAASSDYASSASGTINPDRTVPKARVKAPTPGPGLARPPTPPPVNDPDLAPPVRAKKPTHGSRHLAVLVRRRRRARRGAPQEACTHRRSAACEAEVRCV